MKPRHDEGWLSTADMCRVFDCSRSAFERFVRPLAAPEHIRKEGKQLFFYARGLIEAWALRHRAAVESDALLASSADSPALERYREERAKLARLDRLAREGSLIPRDELLPTLVLLGTILRRATERLTVDFGDEAAAIIREALDDFDREVRRLDDETHQTEKAPHDNGKAQGPTAPPARPQRHRRGPKNDRRVLRRPAAAEGPK